MDGSVEHWVICPTLRSTIPSFCFLVGFYPVADLKGAARYFHSHLLNLKGRTMGIEPTNGGTTNHCLNHLATLAVLVFTIASYLSRSLGVCQEGFEILQRLLEVAVSTLEFQAEPEFSTILSWSRSRGRFSKPQGSIGPNSVVNQSPISVSGLK
jgi:hypothetical protein